MKIIKILMLSMLLFYLVNSIKIKNKVINKCNDCKHYSANLKGCNLFGSTDLVSGKFLPANIKNSRLDESKCGIDAFFFEKNDNISILYRNLNEYKILLLIIPILLYFYFNKRI